MVEFFDKIVLLEKFSGKGGWTFARVPKDTLPKVKFFGMLKVAGSIDEFPFEQKHLMPMGDGTLFLPIAKDIRTKIKKEAGDEIRLRLYAESIPDQIPEELKACLLDVPGKLQQFEQLPESEQKAWIEAIYSAPNEDFKVKQILRLLDFLG